MLNGWELLFIKSNDKIIITFSTQRDLLEFYRKRNIAALISIEMPSTILDLCGIFVEKMDGRLE